MTASLFQQFRRHVQKEYTLIRTILIFKPK
jgi:hypothetical protein